MGGPDPPAPAEKPQPKCFGCCCFMRCGVIVGEILTLVWFVINILFALGGLFTINDYSMARDGALFCEFPAVVRDVYTGEDCFAYDLCDCGGKLCSEDDFRGQMSAGKNLPVVFLVLVLLMIVNAITGLIAVCKHNYPLLRWVGIGKIVIVILSLLLVVLGIATSSGAQQATRAHDSYWRVWGGHVCGNYESSSGPIPDEYCLSKSCGLNENYEANWENAPRIQSAQGGRGGGFGRRLQGGGGGWGGTQMTEDTCEEQMNGPRTNDNGETECIDPRAGIGVIIGTAVQLFFWALPTAFICYLIFCEFKLYKNFVDSLPKGEDDSGYSMNGVTAAGGAAPKHVATVMAVAKPVMATAVAKPVATATAVSVS